MSVTTATRPVGQGSTRAPRPAAPRRRSTASGFWKHRALYLMILPGVVYFLVFKYVPMGGIVIAFQNYQPFLGFTGSEWVGFDNFVRLFTEDTFLVLLRNTLVISGLLLAFAFPTPIVLALLLNELRSPKFKRLVQTVSYLPHFMSVVIVVGMVFQLLSLRGTVNQLIDLVGGSPINFVQEAEWFRAVYIGSEIWQTAGWGTILYLAALTTIDDDLYEAARIDGANRWQQIWHVTLPGIRPTMITLLILNIGTFLAVGFEKILLLYNPLTYPTADVVSTYLYRTGVESNSFSYAAAIGLFEAIVGLVLITSANQLSRRTVGTSLW